MQAVRLADVVHAAHVGMRHLPRDPHFVMEPRQAVRVFRDVLGEEFQRDRLPEFQVFGARESFGARNPDPTSAWCR